MFYSNYYWELKFPTNFDSKSAVNHKSRPTYSMFLMKALPTTEPKGRWFNTVATDGESPTIHTF